MKVPRWIRCYDNGGESVDRYTVVYTRLQGKYPRGYCAYVAMSAYPFHPQGVGMHGGHMGRIDRPRYSHLGKRIRFRDLPTDCKRLVVQDYTELWGDANKKKSNAWIEGV